MHRLVEYFHWEGRFSRRELLIAHLGCFLVVAVIGFTQEVSGVHRWSESLGYLMYPLWCFYGVAVGKRFRDLGCSPWYGIAAMLLPLIGVVLIFISGDKTNLVTKQGEQTAGDRRPSL